MVRKYYDESGKEVAFKTGFACYSGSHAKLYRIGEERLLKRFVIPWDKYDLNMFWEYLKLDLPNFYKIYELLKKENGKFAAYIMQEYINAFEDIIDMPTEYFLTNFENIKSSMDKLGSKHIIVDDLIPSNMIYGAKEITVIDVDNYKQDKNISTKEITKHNEYLLCNAFYRLFRANLIAEYYRDGLNDYTRELNRLFSGMTVSSITKKLENTGYPIEFLERNIRR